MHDNESYTVGGLIDEVARKEGKFLLEICWGAFQADLLFRAIYNSYFGFFLLKCLQIYVQLDIDLDVLRVYK